MRGTAHSQHATVRARTRLHFATTPRSNAAPPTRRAATVALYGGVDSNSDRNLNRNRNRCIVYFYKRPFCLLFLRSRQLFSSFSSFLSMSSSPSSSHFLSLCVDASSTGFRRCHPFSPPPPARSVPATPLPHLTICQLCSFLTFFLLFLAATRRFLSCADPLPLLPIPSSLIRAPWNGGA